MGETVGVGDVSASAIEVERQCGVVDDIMLLCDGDHDVGGSVVREGDVGGAVLVAVVHGGGEGDFVGGHVEVADPAGVGSSVEVGACDGIADGIVDLARGGVVCQGERVVGVDDRVGALLGGHIRRVGDLCGVKASDIARQGEEVADGVGHVAADAADDDAIAVLFDGGVLAADGGDGGVFDAHQPALP